MTEEKKGTYSTRTISNDSIFSYLDKYMDKINREHLEPMICKIQMDSVVIYSNMEHLHPCIISYDIIQKGKISFYPEYRKEDIEEMYNDRPEYPNLNYPFNSSTHLFKLIKMIQKEVE